MSANIIPDSDLSSAEDDWVPSDILDKANEVKINLLPDISRAKYERVYNSFMAWRSTKKIKSLSEPIFLAYFEELSLSNAPSTLCVTFSMLRSAMHNLHQINIFDYSNLMAFLKEIKKGYVPKKSKVLTEVEIAKFINEAPDNQYLAIKVALIFGLTGACRRQDLCNITTNDIIDKGDLAVVNLPNTKNYKLRTFVVADEFYEIYKKYANLRPENVGTQRFFLGYREGKCSSQVIGINTFGGMPKVVAKYLNLPNAEDYTGHTFRRTSATVLADAVADARELRNLGDWMSNTIAEGYVEDSLQNKAKTSCKIMGRVLNSKQPTASTSTEQGSQKNSENFNDFIIENSEDGNEEDNDFEDSYSNDNNSRNNNSKRTINVEEDQNENKVTKKIKLDDGKIIHLYLSNCSNVNIYFGNSTKN